MRTLSTVAVDVMLAPALHELVDGIDSSLVASRIAIQHALDDLVERLGLNVQVCVTVGSPVDLPGPLHVVVGGTACDAATTLADPTLFRGTVGVPWYQRTGDTEAMLTARAGSGDVNGFSMMLAALVADVVRRSATMLVSRDQLASLLLEVGVPSGAVEGLELALRLGIPVRDARDLCTPAALSGGPAPVVIEQVVAALAADQWEIAVQPRYLDALMSSVDVATPGGFATLRERLYTTRGVRLPRLTLTEDPALPWFGFAFGISGLRTPPFIGLPPDAALVVDPSVDDPGIVDPASGATASIFPTTLAADFPAANVTGPVELMAQAMSHAAADRFPSTVTLTSTIGELDLLEHLAPRLTEAVRPQLIALTRRRRYMMEAGTNVRDLRPIAQAVLDEVVRSEELSASSI